MKHITFLSALLLASTPVCSLALTYSEWRDQNFSPADIGNPTVGGEDADPDADGLKNLTEFAIDSNPLLRDPWSHPKTNVDAYGHLTVTFTRRKSHTGYVYVPLVTSRIEGAWQFGTGWVENVSVVERDAETETVTVRDPKAMTDFHKRFIRLLVADDADGDGLPDQWELANGLNPNNANDANADSDSDGIANWLEIAFGLNPFDASDASYDPDADGMTNEQELTNGIDALDYNGGLWDTDGDGIPDLDEILNFTDPSDPFDGGSATITTYGGDGQIGWTDTFLQTPIEFRVKNSRGNPIVGLTVFASLTAGSFSTSSNGSSGLVQSGYMETDDEGFVRLYVKHGVSYNSECALIITLGSGASATQLSYTSHILGNPDGVTAPTNMQCVWSTNYELTLSWEDTSIDETEFVIERSIGDETHYLPIARVAAGTTEFVVPDALTFPNVFYRANSTH